MAHGDSREEKWRGNWRMDWVDSTLHTTSEHGVSSITTADAHISAASSRLNWRPCRFKWTRPFRRKTKTGFCACAITFQTQSTTHYLRGQCWLTNITKEIVAFRNFADASKGAGNLILFTLFSVACSSWEVYLLSLFILLQNRIMQCERFQRQESWSVLYCWSEGRQLIP